MTGGEAQRELDLIIKPRSKAKDSKHDWQDALAIRELKQLHCPAAFKKYIIQLSRYMRDIFTAQRTRRFIHGFLLEGHSMELWNFDRSGPYSSGPFDIHQKPDWFIRALTGYAWMTDDELGLDTCIKRGTGRRFLNIPKDASGPSETIELEKNPFFRQRAIVCRGTSCHRTKDRKHVVKLSWTSDQRTPEADHLKMTREKEVKGVATLLRYFEITSISRMRQD